MKEQNNRAYLTLNETLDDIKKAISSKDYEPEILELTEVIGYGEESSDNEIVTKANSNPLVLENTIEEKTAKTNHYNDAKNEAPIKQPSEENDARFLHSNPAHESTSPIHPDKLNNLINQEVADQSQQILKSLLKQTNKHPTYNMKLSSDITLENIVIEILKPILSDWLNRNLPDIVQKVVEKEIRKLIPRDD